MGPTGTQHERRTRAMALGSLIFAALSFLISGLTLYFSQFRPAEVSFTLGQYVLIRRGPRIGLLGIMANEGSQQAVVTTASIAWDKPAAELSYAMITPGLEKLEQWTTDEGSASPTAYTIAAPVAVKAHEQLTVVLWFVPKNSFVLESGDHIATVTLQSADRSLSRTQFKILLSTIIQKKIQDNPTADFPIRIASQSTLK